MSVLDELVSFVRNASAGDLSPAERAVLRRHTADVAAARLAGAACAEGQAVVSFYPPGRGAETIAGLAALVRLTETDDIHTATGTTASSVAVPVALALAAEARCDGSRLASAIYVSLELVVRLAKAAGGAGILYKGVWPTRAGATLGAAAAAARIWALDDKATRNALALAVLLTSGRTGQYKGEPSGRWFVFASSVAAGIRAAEAARAGFCGDPLVLDNKGLDRALGLEVDTGLLTDGLGRDSILSELSLKPYCTSRQALPGAEAMRALVAEGLDPASIDSFRIEVPAAYAGMIAQKLDPAVRASSYVSGAGLAAIAALAPDALWDIERTAVLNDSRIAALAAKGEVAAAADLDSHYPKRWPARLTVSARGRTYHKEVLEPIGSPATPMSDADLADKSRRVLSHMGLSATAEPLLTVVRDPFHDTTSAAALARFFVEGYARDI